MSQEFTLRCDALPDGLTVAAFRGTEAISRLYEIEVHLIGAEGTSLADLERAVGANATLQVGDDAYVISGVLAAVERTGRASGRPLASATLVPRLWLLGQSLHSRIFTDQTLPQIIDRVLRGAGLGASDFTLQLGKGYAPLDHVCQYRESDYDFLARWMEHEGLYYFFEQGPATERLVITDDRACQKVLREEPIRFSDGAPGADERVHALRRKRRVLPREVVIADHDYLHPDAAPRGTSPVAGGTAGAIRDHRARFADAARGQTLAKRRAEELTCQKTECRLETSSRGLRSGYFFRLVDHPDADVNEEYLVTRLEHEGVHAAADDEVRRLLGFDRPATYRSEALAIPSSTQFRARRSTPWPRVGGHETGVVDGPTDGDTAQIDEHGRYKIKLQLDESDLTKGHASAWIRMMQPYAGSPEGFHFPLRKGTEVILTFLGGDPDRPVIAGAVPDAKRPSPVKRDNATSNIIHTAQGNHFELGDVPGAPFIKLATPHKKTKVHLGACDGDGPTIIILTEGDREEDTGGDHHENIHGNVSERIHGNKHEHVSGKVTEDIDGAKIETISGGEVSTVFGAVVDTIIGMEDKNVVGGEVKIVVGLMPIASQVNIIGIDNKNILGADISNTLGAEMKFVGGGVQETILGGVVEVIVGTKNESIVGAEAKQVLGGALELVAGLEEKIVLGGAIEMVAPIDFKMVLGAVIDMVIGAKIDVVLGVKVDLATATYADEGIELHDAEVHIEAFETDVEDKEIAWTNSELYMHT